MFAFCCSVFAFISVARSHANLIPKERNFDSFLPLEDQFKTDYDELEAGSEFYNSGLKPGFMKLTKHQRMGGARAKRGQFPWQALLVLDDSFMCGGSLISSQWVLTAAHCTYEVENFTVILGTIIKENHTSADGMTILSTQSKFVHDNFDDFSLNNDISLLKLPISVDTSGPYISVIRLPRFSDSTKNFRGKSGYVSGWGKAGDSKPPSESLHFVKRRVVDDTVCLKVYNKLIFTPSVLCIYNGDKRGTCNGDSGGPFVYQEKDKKYTQIGLVSFGSIHSCAKYPGGYTRVPSYLDWIVKITGLSIRS